MNIRKILPLFLLPLLLSCEDDSFEITPREYPRLLIQEVGEITASGVPFTAKFRYRGETEIINYGFVWRDVPEPAITRVPDDSKVEIKENIQDEQFSFLAASGIDAGVKYYVRAFIQTSDYTVYSTQVTFVSGLSF